LLGVLEGATEFLPVSSTGHLILASHVLAIPETPFLASFLIAIQLGAIGAVVALYWRSLLDIELLKRLFAAFLPTAVVGFVLYQFIKNYLLNNELVVVIALLVGGILLVLFERWYTEPVDGGDDIRSLRYRDAFAIGLFQSIAVIPGVSRSAATIAGGLLLGIRRVAIVEFSFLLAVPTMLAATGYDILRSYETFEAGSVGLLFVGAATAFVVALVALRTFTRFIKRYTFTPFGFYRIALALLFLLFIL